MTQASLQPTAADDLAAFTQILGADRVSSDPAARALFSQDIWSQGPCIGDVIASPANTADLARIVAEAAARGYGLAVRGGGMSYTQGYTPAETRTVILDLTGLDKVLAIRPDDMTVTVQAGCTWKTLLDALKPLGLRTPFWGPLSGISSTIGGGLSQQNAFFGAGRYGTTSESVVGVTVVLADGEVLRTGARSARTNDAFYRHYGPDLTGLFCGDCGVLGVKAEITLRLMRAPAHEDYASFVFDTREALVSAMVAIVRDELATEVCGFDPGLGRVRLKRASMMSGVKSVAAVAGSGKTLLSGLKDAARIAMAGRGFIDDAEWSLHLGFEGRSRGAVDHDIAEARRLAGAAGGRETEPSIPRILRAQPFTPLNNILGPDGERWAPVHGIVSLSDAQPCFAAIEALFDGFAERFDAAGVQTGYMLTALANNGFLIEPVFLWPEARMAIHDATMEPSFLSRLPRQAAHPEITALVAEARKGVVDVFQTFGSAHFQIGRTYPWLESRDAASRTLVEALKASLDPDGRLNKGVLGL